VLPTGGIGKPHSLRKVGCISLGEDLGPLIFLEEDLTDLVCGPGSQQGSQVWHAVLLVLSMEGSLTAATGKTSGHF